MKGSLCFTWSKYLQRLLNASFFFIVVNMSNSKLSNIDFAVLDISGKNYLPWTLDAEIHLTAKKLGETIQTGNTASAQARAKAMIFLLHHLHEDLKKEYLTVKDPLILWL